MSKQRFNPNDYIPSEGKLLVKAVPRREKNKLEEEKHIMPPSDYFVVKDGKNILPKGTELILSSGMITHIKDQKEYFFIDERDIAGYNTTLCK